MQSWHSLRLLFSLSTLRRTHMAYYLIKFLFTTIVIPKPKCKVITHPTRNESIFSVLNGGVIAVEVHDVFQSYKSIVCPLCSKFKTEKINWYNEIPRTSMTLKFKQCQLSMVPFIVTPRKSEINDGGRTTLNCSLVYPSVIP